MAPAMRLGIMIRFIVVEEAAMQRDGSTNLGNRPRRTMRRTVAILALLAAAPLPPAPRWMPGKAVDVIGGVAVADPYRGLENAAGPAVRAWSDAENARTRAFLDALPGRAGVAARLAALTQGGSPSFYAVKPGGTRLFALYRDPARQQPALVTLADDLDPASRRIVVDPNAIDTAGHVEIDWFVPSPDGSKVAVSLSRGGSEDGTLHVYDVASGREVDTPIPAVQYPTAGGSLAWTADGQGFWYTRYPGADASDAERHFNQAVYRHRIGEPAAKDGLVLSGKDGLPRTGEIFLSSAGGSVALASVQLGDGGQWQQFVLRDGQPALKVGAYEDRIVAATLARDGTLYGLSRRDAPMGKVLRLAAPYTGGFAAARVIIPERHDAAIIDGGATGEPLVLAGDRLIVNRIAGGPSRVTVYALDGTGARDLPVPPVAGVGEIVPLPDGDLLYSVSTYLDPTRFLRWSPMGGASPTPLTATSPVSFADCTVTRLFATSKDGTRIPYTAIARKGIVLDGRNPTLLYGYGGFGISMTPAFLGAMRRVWLDAGGVYVVANLRGGGEYGESWHRAGTFERKQNVFDDFDAVAEALIARRYTNHARLALMGGSNGGLLMGATLTQHPGLARAVVSSVGIYDMIRSEQDANGAFNVTEYGTVTDPAQFRAIHAYSPYHHVVPGTAYPAVLMLTGANDGRVNPLQSRKFAAALQSAQAAPDHPILLRTSETSGHGIGSSQADRNAEATDQLMFLFDQLGVTPFR